MLFNSKSVIGGGVKNYYLYNLENAIHAERGNDIIVLAYTELHETQLEEEWETIHGLR